MDEHESKSTAEAKGKWLYGVIGLLAILLTVQTGAVVYYLFQREKPKPEKTYAEASFAPRYAAPQAGAGYAGRRGPAASPVRSSAWDDPFFEDAFSSIGRMYSRMNRLFEGLSAFSQFGDFIPSLDLEDTGQAYVVRCDLPGLDKDQITVSVRDNQLTLQGVKRSEAQTEDSEYGFYTQERSYGSFARSIPLPGPVDESNISARYEQGVLTIRLPKATEEQAKEKKIQVS